MVGRALACGRRVAVLTVVGNAFGEYVQVIAVAVGVGALAEQSVAAFTTLKLVGGAYLIYLGVKTFRERRSLAAALAAPVTPRSDRLAWCTTCATETTVSPHASAIALPVLPPQAFSNLVALRTDYPGVYTADGGFYDAVNPVTGVVGHRRLVLDQSMIMAALDDALNDDALGRRFAADPVSWAARRYLSTERMSIG